MITDPQKYFYVCDGKVLKDLVDMLAALREIDDETFAHHVNSEKNDFYNWTRDVLKDAPLAKKLSMTIDRAEMIAAVESREKVVSKNHKKKAVISQIQEAIASG